MGPDNVSLKEYFEEILSEKDKASEQRFRAQEVALEKAEFNRDTAIKKAEDSIEKKSDAVYVKLTDLQKAFSEVMLRQEIEGRLQAMAKDIQTLTKTTDLSQGKGAGLHQGWAILIAVVTLFLSILGIASLIVSFLK